VLGGSGSINAMVWTRGHRADYDDWAEAGNAGWDFHSVLPLFKRSEDWEGGASAFRGAGGPIRVERARNLHPVAAAFIEAGTSYGMPYLDDVNVPEPEGVGPMNLNVKGGTRCSPAGAYLRPVMGNQNLTVLTEALAVKLTLTGTRCTGVDVLLDGAPGRSTRRASSCCPASVPMPTSGVSASRPSPTSRAWGATSRTMCGYGASASPRSTRCPPRITISGAAPASGKASRGSAGRT